MSLVFPLAKYGYMTFNASIYLLKKDVFSYKNDACLRVMEYKHERIQ